jgi:magnesium-transporting ATPase (P-type)
MICINKSKLTKNGKEKESVSYCGLTTSQAEASRRAHGANCLTERKRAGFWRHFLSNLNDPVIRVLLIALGLHLLLMFRQADWLETIGIAASVLLATTISTASQLGSESAFARLQAEGARVRCRVLRDGVTCELAQEEVVVGDVVLLSAGEHIPADGLLIEGELTLDQAALTGESREVIKRAGGVDTGEPGDEVSLYRGCAVLGGAGRLLVRGVGDGTVLGGISQEVQVETRESPLKLRLSKLAGQISVLGYVAAVLVAVAFLFHAFVIDSGFHGEIIRMKLYDLPFLFDTLLNALMLGLTVVVVAVPEGLPMMVAVVLSANMRRMIRDHVLVRKPAGIEAAGSMDILFTDKTGTLTDGRLRVGCYLTGEGGTFDSLDALERSGRERFSRYLMSAYYGGGASVGTCGTEQAKDKEKRCAIGGNTTDRALLSSVMEHPAPTARVVERLPFDSARKYAATVLETDEGRSTVVMGAPELLLPHISRYTDGEGREKSLDKAAFFSRVRQHAGAGERVILLAQTEQTDLRAVACRIPEELTLLCALTLSDHLRPEAAEAVRTLHGAGVQVVMITGDSPDTAERIAHACGILNQKTDVVLTGSELAALSDHQLKQLLPRLGVVARALPTDKSRLVRLAQEQERVVGMTGDGINDAPALRRADIGFAMGSGAAVAREAGDILILDDNLASIVRAVLYGRTIFKSIRKFITLQLTMNFCAVGVSMIGPFIGVNAPVTVVQMLWINLIMDTLGGLAFAGEAPLPSYLSERPKRRDEPILGRYMVNEIVFLGGYTVALCVLFLKHPAICARFRSTPGDLCHLTAFFALFIFASVFNCFNARTDRLRPFAGLSQNRAFLGIMIAVLIVQIVFVYLGGSVLRTMPLSASELALTALLALSVLPAEKVRGLLWRMRGRRERY